MRIVVKVGTSTLAHQGGRLNIRRVELLCKVLSDLKNAGHQIILVTSGASISSRHPAMEARLRQLTLPAGAPACSAAAATSFAAAREHCSALGWGEKTMALPAFNAIIAL